MESKHFSHNPIQTKISQFPGISELTFHVPDQETAAVFSPAENITRVNEQLFSSAK